MRASVRIRSDLGRRHVLSALLVLLLGGLFSLSACAAPPKLPQVDARFVGVGGEMSPTFNLEICANDSARSLGLMFRRSLAERSGMIFIFPTEEEHSFWMKNTYLSLDMVFVDQGMRVVGILHDVPPLNETLRSVETPSKYVLEFGAGVTKRLGIVEGARLEVLGDLPAPR